MMELVVALSLRDEPSVPRCHLEHTFIRDVTLTKMSGTLKFYSGFQLSFSFLYCVGVLLTYMSVNHVHAMPKKARRRFQVPQSWS